MPHTPASLDELRKLSILYIEDEPFIRESTVELLSLYFDTVDTAEDGEKALRCYEAFKRKHGTYYDIVLTDLQMPKVDGIKLIKRIRHLHERQIFVVLTAHDESRYLIELIELEISHIIFKPITVERFERVFSNVLGIIKQRIAFRRLYKQLEDALEQKSRFLANMSHEVRTPLNAILGFLTLLEDKETDQEKLKYLKIIRSSSDSLLNIINDVLDLSKIESGKLSIHPVDFDPYEDLIATAELFQAKSAEKNITFQIRYNRQMPEKLHGDVLRIKQILTNLLSNAVKFTPEGSKIKCIIWYKDGRLNIKVKDYGIGIDAKKQREIFDPFIQVESEEKSGTGLGLSISKELTDLLGGTLSLESTPGRGSTFTLSLPVAPVKSRPKPSQNTHTAEKLDGDVLVVEDIEANRMFVCIILQNAGLRCDTANNGAEAVEKYRGNRYDLILMDENMPVMGGTEAAKHIAAIEKEQALAHTPVVALTANALHGDKERFLQAGFDDYLSKPVDPATLLATLSTHLQANPSCPIKN